MLSYRYREQDYLVSRLGEAWVIEVDGGQYFLSMDDPDLARRFISDRLRNAYPYGPSSVASQRYPLMLEVDGVTVRAWPALIPRNRPEWAKTYVDPRTGDRVGAVEGPVWMFAARGRQASGCGTTNYQQTLDDVRDLAKIWLRAPEG